jgi:hypothetical protein
MQLEWMKSVPDNSPAESSSSIPIVSSIPTSVRVWLWICLTAWAISFFLPAAKVNLGGGGRPALGWEIAYDALILLVVPVKGAYVAIFRALWTVFINPFRLLIPSADQADGGEGRSLECSSPSQQNFHWFSHIFRRLSVYSVWRCRCWQVSTYGNSR